MPQAAVEVFRFNCVASDVEAGLQNSPCSGGASAEVKNEWEKLPLPDQEPFRREAAMRKGRLDVERAQAVLPIADVDPAPIGEQLVCGKPSFRLL